MAATSSGDDPNLDYIVDYLPLQLEVLYAEAVELFNLKPAKAISFLVDRKVIENTPADVAQFFFTQTKLSKRLVGEYLGTQDTFNQSVAECLFALFPFQGLSLDEGIRALARRIRLPGEAQKIDRILEKFAASYHKQNANKVDGLSLDALYILSFSIIMLNTDLHNPSIARSKKMTVNEFIRNNRGINVGVDLPPAMLKDLYQKIKRQAITMNEEDMFESTEFNFLGPIKAGWLEKDVNGYIGRTVKRWFVLKNSCLYYFSTPSEKIPRCIIPLDGVSVSKISTRHILITGRNGESKIKARKNLFKQKNMFSVSSNAETLSTRTSLRLGAPSEAECFDWYIHLKGETEPINGILNHAEGKDNSPLTRADGKGIVDESLQQDIKQMVEARNSLNLTNSEGYTGDVRSSKGTSVDRGSMSSNPAAALIALSPAKIRIASFSLTSSTSSRDVKRPTSYSVLSSGERAPESAGVTPVLLSAPAAEPDSDEIPPPQDSPSPAPAASLFADDLSSKCRPSPSLITTPLPPREVSGSSRRSFNVLSLLSSSKRRESKTSPQPPPQSQIQTPEPSKNEGSSKDYVSEFKSNKSTETTPVLGLGASTSMYEMGTQALDSDVVKLRRRSISAGMNIITAFPPSPSRDDLTSITPDKSSSEVSTGKGQTPLNGMRDSRMSEPSSPAVDENALNVDRVSMYLEGRAMLLHRNLARNVNLRRPSDPLQLVLSAPIKEGWLLVRDCTEKFRYNSADAWVMKYCLLCDSIDKFGPTLFYFPCREAALYMQRYADQTQQRYVRIKFADFLSVNSVGLPANAVAADGKPLRISPLRLSPHRKRANSDSKPDSKAESKTPQHHDAKSEGKTDEKAELRSSGAKSEAKETLLTSASASKPHSTDSSTSTSPTPTNSRVSGVDVSTPKSSASNQSTPRRTTSNSSSSKKHGIVAALQRMTSLASNVSRLAKQVEEEDNAEEKESAALTPVKSVLREADGRDSPDSPNFEIREQIWRKMDAATAAATGNRKSLSKDNEKLGNKSLWRKFESGIPLDRSPPVRGMTCRCATCSAAPALELGECQVRVRCKDASQQLFDVYLSHPDTRELWRWFDKFKDIAVNEFD